MLRAAGPFHRVTNVATNSSGDLYIADGYGNARVHKFSKDGKLLFSWGEPGRGPGQFILPHGIGVDSAGLVYVADRENSRVQVFDPGGDYVREWGRDSGPTLNRPYDIFIDDQDMLRSFTVPRRRRCLRRCGLRLRRRSWIGKNRCRLCGQSR